MRLKNLYGAALACALIPTIARGGAFEGPGLGARAIGMGGAFIGLADDWTAIYWNPAGLSRLKGTQIGFSLEAVRVKVHDSNGLANPTVPLTEDHIVRGDIFTQMGGEPSQFNGLDSRSQAFLPALGFHHATRNGLVVAGGGYSPLGFDFDVADASSPGFDVSFKSRGYILNH